MAYEQREIAVGVDGTAPSQAALGWAAADAAARGLPLRILCMYEDLLTWETTPYQLPDATVVAKIKDHAQDVVNDAVARVRQSNPGLRVSGTAIARGEVNAFLDEAKRAALIVLGSRRLSAVRATVLGSVSAAVAARADCPVVVVRGIEGSRDKRAATVAAVSGKENSDAVLAFAFDHASVHHTPLDVVLAWRPGVLASITNTWRPAPEEAERVLAEAAAGWQEKYPDVDVRRRAVVGYASEVVLTASIGAHLVVLGSHGHSARVATVLGSVTQAALHHADCPVAVVPIRH